MPALLTVLAGVDEVVAVGLVFQASGGKVDGKAAQSQGGERGPDRPAADGADKRGKKRGERAGPLIFLDSCDG